jgi:hypothetical protein
MIVALSAAVVIFGALVFLLLGSQVEMYRDIAQLRDHSGLIDRPMAVDIAGAVGARPSSFGLPAPLDAVDAGLVLFLSDKCGTCRSIAASLDGQVPRDLWLVLDPANPMKDPELTVGYRLGRDRVTIDRRREISSALGVTITPAALILRDGRIVRASTVPSTRQLQTLLDSLRAAEDDKPLPTTIEMPRIPVSTGGTRHDHVPGERSSNGDRAPA